MHIPRENAMNILSWSQNSSVVKFPMRWRYHSLPSLLFEIQNNDLLVYFAAPNKNWDLTHCDKLELGLVIFVSKSSVVNKNSDSVSVK